MQEHDFLPLGSNVRHHSRSNFSNFEKETKIKAKISLNMNVFEELVKYVDTKVAVGYWNIAHEIDTKWNPTAVSNFTTPNAKLDSDSAFFIVQHQALSGEKAEAMRQQFPEMNEEVMGSMQESMLQNGVFSSNAIPTTCKSTMFCIWEASKGKSVEDVHKWLSENMPVFQNVYHEINTDASPYCIPEPKF